MFKGMGPTVMHFDRCFGRFLALAEGHTRGQIPEFARAALQAIEFEKAASAQQKAAGKTAAAVRLNYTTGLSRVVVGIGICIVVQ